MSLSDAEETGRIEGILWGLYVEIRRPCRHLVPTSKFRRIVGSLLVCLALLTLEICDAQAPNVLPQRLTNQ